MAEADERFDESLAVMLKAWTSDSPWSHHGKHWQFEGVVVEPPRPSGPTRACGWGREARTPSGRWPRSATTSCSTSSPSSRRSASASPSTGAEVEARGRIFDPLSVGVTRSVNVVMTAEERERAVATRLAGRQRIDRLTVGPDGQGRARHLTVAEAEAGALYGTPDEVADKLQALRDVGAEYILLNSQGGLPTIRRFARELMPAFAGAPAVAAST